MASSVITGNSFNYNSLSSPGVYTSPRVGDTIIVNGSTLMWDGYQWVYQFTAQTSGSDNTFTWTNGDNVSNQVSNLYDELLFVKDWSYEPWTVINTRSGKVVAKVHEVRRGSQLGLKSDSSLYAVLGEKGEITYPLHTWAKLLEKLGD